MDDEARETFARIYDTDAWDGGSGVGSAADATAPYRAAVERLCRARDVRSVVDVGCGDWQLGSLVDWGRASYTGLDVVPSVIESNRVRYADDGIGFELGDARRGPLPPADLLLAKDVLQHWPNADVAAFLSAHLGRYRYVLLTNDVASAHWDGPVNQDIALGAWRTLDLEAPPFGRRAAWRGDYDVRGAWTKRMLLLTSASWRRVLPGSALRAARSGLDRRAAPVSDAVSGPR